MMEEGERMAMKSAMPESLDASQTSQLPMPTGEPSFDIVWSIVAVLCVLVVGLAIEVIISSRKKKLSY